MGTYKVKPDGKAPAGLSIGDVVVTGGGSYVITGFKSDGSYQSKLIDAKTTTQNYKGKYDQISGGADLNTSATWDDLASLLKQELSSGINSGSGAAGTGYQAAALPDIKAMSFDDAMKLARNALKPQFEASYAESAVKAGQNLDKAGIYDTVYGQALAANAQRDVAADLNTAIVGLALQLSNAGEEKAQKILELAVKDRQFGAEYTAEQKSNALKYLVQLMS